MRRGWTAQPQAIDDLTGFKVNYKDLKRQWDGAYSVDPDKRNPQDMIRARPENPKLDHARPEAIDRFFADNITLEDGITPIICEDGTAMMTEGTLNGAGL
jgi:hypothetical protein